MSHLLKAAFMVVIPGANSGEHRAVICSEALSLTTVFVGNYEEAALIAKELLKDGVIAIELCAGFGNRGVQIVSEAVDYQIPVGAVRFDNHPALNNQSGDQLF